MKLIVGFIMLLQFSIGINSVTINVVPIQYVTETDITTKAKETFIFSLKTCGGAYFDKCVATVYVNFPDKPWKPIVSDFVTVTIIDIHGHTIATNYDSKTQEYVPQFDFTYLMSYGDLVLNVTSGNAPDFKYTLSVTFDCDHRNETKYEPRYYQTEEEIKSWEMIKAQHPEGNCQDLVTIFKTQTPGIVETGDVVVYELQYCFDTHLFPGSISLTTVAIDEVSGFATYACTANNIPCESTEDAKYFDISGAAINFLTIPLTVEAQAGPVKVLVRGDGRYLGNNKFTLGASKFSGHA